MSLTPLGLALAAFTMLLGALGQWSATLGAFPWWRLAAGALILGLAYELAVTRGVALGARVRGAARLYLGREQPLHLEVENTLPRPVTVQLAPVWPAGISGSEAAVTLRAAAHGAATVRFGVRPVATGAHAWRPLPARVRGPLGLAWWSRTLRPASELRVVPDVLGRRAAAAGSTQTGPATQAAIGGARELHHLRDYRPGDARHAIDWKATARASRLVTRVFSEDQHLEVLILLDAGRTSRTEIDGMSQFGHYVNLAARFAEYCVAGDDQVGLVAFADGTLATLGPGRGVEAVARIRRALDGLTPRAAESDVVSAALHVRRLVRRRCLVVLLTDLYERTATSQLVQSTRLLARKHLPMVVGLLGEEILRLGDAPAADWLDPYRSLAAREYRRDVDANLTRLARLGARALVARPAELERKVLGEYASLRARRRI